MAEAFDLFSFREGDGKVLALEDRPVGLGRPVEPDRTYRPDLVLKRGCCEIAHSGIGGCGDHAWVLQGVPFPKDTASERVGASLHVP
ncbi:hypothetical protein BH11ARM2_BH11ARM2_15520 [soil metagenome]